MKVPPEITYREVEKTAAIETLIAEKIVKLERMCDYINSCHIAIEKINDRPRSGSPYRVRIDLTVPPNYELVVDCNPAEQNQYVKLDAVIRDAFNKMETQIRKLTEQQREHEQSKNHNDATEITALVTKVFHEDGYGFIRDLTGAEEVYFHRNSVLHGDFDRIEVGTDVRYSAIDRLCLSGRENGSTSAWIRRSCGIVFALSEWAWCIGAEPFRLLGEW